jgi:PKD repeat protein
MHTSVAHVGLRHASDGSYWIYSYWTADNGTQLNSNFQIPAASVVNNRVTVSICSYDSNRTNVIRSGPTLKVTTPYTTETTRKLPYTNVIQPLIYADCYASGTGGWVNLHFYNITQSIPRDIITPYARNDIMGFGFDYPNVPNNKNGTDFLISRGQSASVYLSDTNMANSTDIAYDQSLFANGFEEGIHFYPGLTSQSLEQAKQTIDTHMAAAEATFGSLPTSWACHQNEDTITHAIYAYNKYGALYRNGPMGMAFITNVDTLSNATWAWWSVSSARGAVSPCFTHRTDEYPAIPYSIDPDLFENFVTNLNSNGINLVNFSNWYYSSMAQNATIKNIEYDANYTEFQLNTSGGYPVIINMQIASHSQLYYNGVPIPFNQTSDGIQFMSAGNGTYTLTGPQVPPVANFTADLTVQFTDTSTNRPIRWDWNFGDGSTSTEQNPVHVYGDEGTYNVTLVATNTGGSSDVRSMVIAINSVAANFTANKTEGTAPLTVQFTDTSTNSPTSWNWNFGDGNFSTEQNPEHTFGDDGIYNVTLVATNAGNSSSPGSSSPGSSPGSPSPADPSVVDSSDVKSMNIIVKEPSADFTANRTEGTAPLTVQFTDTSTNSPTSWDWNFGDGNSSTEQNPVHVFSINGTYNVTLVATNAGGSSDVKAMNITVNRVLIPPVANFTANRTEGTAPLTVQFTDTSTNSPTSRDWNFGDGANSTDANPVHVYATAGTYVANLTASNADGTDTESKTITVTGPVMGSPKARFTAVPQMGSAPLTVNFTDNSVNATSIVWDFGDRSATSTEANPSHIYKTAGFYTVKLTATSGSKSSVASKIIVVGK